MAHATQVIETQDAAATSKTISGAMSRRGMSVDRSGDHPVWSRQGTNEAYPLVMECGIGRDGNVVARGYVLGEDGEHLSLDGDDGISHHAKSLARDMFEEICEEARASALTGDAGAEEPAANEEPAPHPGIAVPASQQAAPRPAPVPAVVPQPMPQARPAYRPQYGYAAQGQPMGTPVAPGWVVDSVPNRCTLYVMLSLGLLFALAGMPFVMFIVLEELAVLLLPIVLFLSLFCCWPAIVAVVYAFSYRKAFMLGDGMRASRAMRLARGWIIGSSCVFVLLTLLQAVSCS